MQTTTLEAVEFIRRFILHVLPKGFMRIRHYGFLANRCKRENFSKKFYPSSLYAQRYVAGYNF